MAGRRKTREGIEARKGPLVFLSYDPHNAVEARTFAETLRGYDVLVEIFPCEPHPEQVLAALQNSPMQIDFLAVALSDRALERTWFDRTIGERLKQLTLEHVPPPVLSVELTKLGKEVPPYIGQRFDLSGDQYADGTETFASYVLAKVGRPKVKGPRPFSRKKGPAHFVVTGIFELARPADQLLGELKSQIDEGYIDQRYLYWELSSAMRWQSAAEASGYRTSQVSMNLLVENSGRIARTVVGDGVKPVSFINLGVGTGQKDREILRNLLQRSDNVTYFAVDDSFPMIQITMKVLEALVSANSDRLKLRFVVDDFLKHEKYVDFIEQEEPEGAIRLIGFLGTSLGNFPERRILSAIRTLMSEEDFLLVGTELISDKADTDLIANYDDPHVQEFLYGPIADVFGMPTGQGLDALFEYEVSDRISDVPGARTVIARARRNGHRVELLKSTKYDLGSLRRFFGDMGFGIVEEFLSGGENPIYAKMLLRLGAD